MIMLHNQNKYIMAEKLEFSEKLVYDYFKQHKLHKSGADAVIQMVQFARSEETEPSEALQETINRYLNDRCSNMAANDKERIKSRHHDIAAGIIFFCCNFCHRDEIEKMESIAPILARNFNSN